MEIKILGTGCAKCKNLEKLTIEALNKLEIKASVIKIEDITEIMKYGIMSTPALVIDEEVKISGRLPKIEEIIKVITK
ncbi:MAG: thioredoxin family protein [Bacteroidales bacterium]